MLKYMTCIYFPFCRLFFSFSFLFWPCHVACRILVPQPGIELTSPATKLQSPNHRTTRGFPDGARGKESACQCRRCKRFCFSPWIGKIPWRRKRQPTPVFLAGKFHGQRNLAGYTAWIHKESEATEHIPTHTHRDTHTHPVLYGRTLPCIHSVCTPFQYQYFYGFVFLGYA